jgi:hypothetical protein
MTDLLELDFGKMYSWYAQDNKDISAVLGVFKGNASITVWNNKSIALRIPLGPFHQVYLRSNLEKAFRLGPDQKTVGTFTKFDPKERKSSVVATVVFGRDSKNLLYIAMGAPGFQSTKFLFRLPMSIDPPENEVEGSELAAKTFISVLSDRLPIAQSLSCVARKDDGPNKNYNASSKPNATSGSYSSSSEDTVY